MATMRDVAARAGVSPKTVSRVFNDDPHVLPETKQRVEAALRDLDYVLNPIATAFRAGRAPVIGVAVPDILDPFFGSITRAAETLAASQGMSILIATLGEAQEREADIVGSLLRQSLSGLIIAPISHDHTYLRSWGERMPIVFVDRLPIGIRADSFTEDDVAGGRLATGHLLGHGHRRVAFLGDDLSIPTTAARLTGYRAALAAAGQADGELVAAVGTPDRRRAAEAVRGFGEGPGPPSAVFCSNARVAMSVVPLLRDHDLAVTSFGDFPLADVLTPSLTVIDQDPDRLGRLAAQRIVDRLAGPGRRYRRRTVLPVDLIERHSCTIGRPRADATVSPG